MFNISGMAAWRFVLSKIFSSSMLGGGLASGADLYVYY